MTDTHVIRRMIVAAAGYAALPLAIAGCQHHHPATTQIVLVPSSTEPTVAEVATTESSTPEASTPEASAPESSAPMAKPASPGVGQKFANGSRDVGHNLAQGSRDSYHATANGVRAVGSSVASLTTDSVQGIRNSPPESLTAPIIDVDAAMQVRDWDQVTAEYKSGATVAGPIGFLYEPKGGQPVWHYGVIELPLFLVNTGLLPYAFCKTPPWDPVEWKAATVAPTYTGVPPLPPLP